MNVEDLIEPPFNYTGSKFKLLPQLIPLFYRPETESSRFIDLFAGGGSVYTNVAHLYGSILVNDIIADLMGIHHKLIAHVDQVITITKGLVVGKEDQDGYNALRASYNASPCPEKLWALMLCCTNNMMRFNQSLKFNQTFGKRTFNERTEFKARRFAERLHPYLNKIIFRSGDFGTIEPQELDMVYGFLLKKAHGARRGVSRVERL